MNGDCRVQENRRRKNDSDGDQRSALGFVGAAGGLRHRLSPLSDRLEIEWHSAAKKHSLQSQHRLPPRGRRVDLSQQSSGREAGKLDRVLSRFLEKSGADGSPVEARHALRRRVALRSASGNCGDRKLVSNANEAEIRAWSNLTYSRSFRRGRGSA